MRRVALFAVAVLAAFACSELREGEVAPASDDGGATSSSSSGKHPGTSSSSGDDDDDDVADTDAGAPDDCPTGVCVLASNRRSPADLVVRNGFVYWVEQGTPQKAGKDGRVSRASTHPCAEDGGCASDIGDAGANLSGLAVNATDVFLTYTTNGALGRVTRMPIADGGGGARTVISNAEDGARRIVLSNTRAFWVNAGGDPGTGQIRVGAVDDSPPILPPATIVDALDSPAAIALVRETVFFSVRGRNTNDGSIQSVGIDGDGQTTIASAQAQPRGVAVDPTFVYWVNRGDGTVHRARWDGTESKELVTSARSPTAIAVDSDGIYWAEAGTDPDLLDGRLRSADLDGKNAKTLGDVPAPVAIAVDGAHVYAAVRGTLDNSYSDGAIVKTRKR